MDLSLVYVPDDDQIAQSSSSSSQGGLSSSLVIGIVAGVVGILLLGLVLAVTFLIISRKKNKKKKKNEQVQMSKMESTVGLHQTLSVDKEDPKSKIRFDTIPHSDGKSGNQIYEGIVPVGM